MGIQQAPWTAQTTNTTMWVTFDSIAAWFKSPTLSILPLNCQGLKILSIEGCGASIKIDEIFDVENINLTVPLSLDIDEMIWPEGSDFPYEIRHQRSAARSLATLYARRFKTKIHVRQQNEDYID